jgi:hypothetical protein
MASDVAPTMVAPVDATPTEAVRRETLLFRAAIAVLAAHAVVDAILAPEPGTRWDDHLVRGSVTLAVLAAVALAYPRLRAGARAALAAVLAVLSLVGAVLAVFDARAVGARGEDWTGFLLWPVALVLAALAVTLLWRSRKPGRLRYLRRAGIALGTMVAAYVVVAPLAIAIVATHRPRAEVEPLDLGRPYEEVTLRTADGLDLAAWYVPSRNGAAVISFPTRKGKPAQARMLARHGYGVLLLDARGYDGSDGDPNAYGWETDKDIDAAVAWLQERPDVRDGRVGGIGFSVGGEMMLDAAASNEGLRAVVSEGAGERSVRETLIRGPRGWPAVPTMGVQTGAVALLSGSAPPPALDDLVGRIAPRAVLLISAGRGGGGEELNADYFRAASEPKELWEIPEAGHVGGFQARPRAYERRVVGFFDRALGVTSS